MCSILHPELNPNWVQMLNRKADEVSVESDALQWVFCFLCWVLISVCTLTVGESYLNIWDQFCAIRPV